jgi:predicted nucleic acid-binding protein
MSCIYLDSNLYVYYFEGHPEFGHLARSIVERARQPQHRIYSSLFVLSELLVEPVRLKDEFRIASLNRFFRSDAVTLLPYGPEAVSIYASLRADYRIKPLNALHLACAACTGVDLFITNDIALKHLTVPGIGIIAGFDAQF